MNEYQVAIGETTFGGREELMDPKAVVDYGSLMNLALQRGRTAREALQVMTSLVEEYGYASSGESFSISDPNEVWILEMIAKGPERKGAVWVARLVPDGYVCAHANQPRIRRFPLQKANDFFDKKQTVFHAPDVVSFAREKGYFKGADSEFSFADAYCAARLRRRGASAKAASGSSSGASPRTPSRWTPTRTTPWASSRPSPCRCSSSPTGSCRCATSWS